MLATKAFLRVETQNLVAQFKASGGVVEIIPARKKRKIKLGCSAKNSKSFKTSTKPVGVRTSVWK